MPTGTDILLIIASFIILGVILHQYSMTEEIYNKCCKVPKATKEVTFWIVNPKNSLAEVFSGTFEQWSTMEIEDRTYYSEHNYTSRQKTVPCGIIIEKTSGHVFKVPPEQITFIK